MKVIIIGGGPAGMLAAITSAQKGNETTIIEKNNRLGKKLLITGKGRCNITSSIDINDFINNIPGNGKFLYSAFQNYTNKDIIHFFEKNGVSVKEERGNRIFPKSDKSLDVEKAFEREITRLHINVKLNSKVTNILVKNNKVEGVKYLNSENIEKTLYADKIILATGGATYPLTGSTGDGYKMAEQLGHTVTKIKPSLVPLTASRGSIKICQKLQGLSLRNVAIRLMDVEKSKKIYEDFGEMIFTHFGVSGPTILSSSAHLLRYKNVEELLANGKIILEIDLKPALSEQQLDLRIQRDFSANKNKEFKNSLDALLPQKLIPVIVDLSGIDEDKKVNEVTKEERLKLVELLKKFTVTISGFRPLEEGIITAGGISVKEINPKTMESKIVEGLFFAGEIIDVDAYTGGFNLQIAYSTGYTAGL